MKATAMRIANGVVGWTVSHIVEEMLKTPQRRQEGDKSRCGELVSRKMHGRTYGN